MPERLIHTVWRTNRTFPLVIGALLLLNLSSFLGIVFFLSPRVEALEKRYIDSRNRAQQAVQRQERLATPQERFRRNQEDLQTFWKAIPPRAEFTDLIREIFSVAEESGLSIERISYEPKLEADRSLLRYAMAFSVAGDYSQIKKFIYSLEQSPRIVALEELTLTGKEGSEGEAVNLRIRLSTYFKSPSS